MFFFFLLSLDKENSLKAQKCDSIIKHHDCVVQEFEKRIKSLLSLEKPEDNIVGVTSSPKITVSASKNAQVSLQQQQQQPASSTSSQLKRYNPTILSAQSQTQSQSKTTPQIDAETATTIPMSQKLETLSQELQRAHEMQSVSFWELERSLFVYIVVYLFIFFFVYFSLEYLYSLI